MEKLSSWIFPKCFKKIKQKDDQSKEKLWPNKQSWFQKKIQESWKLTEKDIREAIKSGTDGFTKDITELERKIKNMDSELRLMSQVNKEEGITKAYMQNEIKNMELRLMSQLNKIEETIFAALQEKIKTSMDTK